MIKQNQVREIGRFGLGVETGARASVLAIENNEFRELALGAARVSLRAGIALHDVERVDLVDNVVARVARTAESFGLIAGVFIGMARSVRLVGNEIVDIGPSGRFAGIAAGIGVTGVFSDLEVVDNVVRRSLMAPIEPDRSGWVALETVGFIPG